MISSNDEYICKYYPDIDRFCVSKEAKSNTFEYVSESKFFKSFDYYRYIPGKNLTLKQIDKYLIKHPFECCFEITKSCNLRCRVCISESIRTQNDFLTISKFNRIIEKNNFSRITFSGGEPTLHPDIYDLIKLSSAKTNNIIFSTNGTNLEKIEEILSDFSNIILAISLHGPKDQHDDFVGANGSFDKAIKCIQIAMDNKANIHVYSTVTRETFNTLIKLSEITRAFDIKEHRLNLVKPVGRLLSEFVPYNDVLQMIKSIDLPHKTSVKRRDQPFLFINANGKEKIRNVRRY